MEFPERERVVYASNPLAEVVCQVRFPKVLEIESRLPTEFQRFVAKDFPLLQTHEAITFGFGAAGGPQTPVRSQIYEFSTIDRLYKLTLASDFVAVATPTYHRWEEFRPRVEKALLAVMKHYEPAVFTRLGLRYQDVIIPNKLGLTGTRWKELIRPTLVGILGDDLTSDEDVIEYQSALALRLKEGTLTLRHGLARNTETNDLGYLLDNDFFLDTPIAADINHALGYLDGFNREAGRVFRWCIQDKLHHALQPTPVESRSND